MAGLTRDWAAARSTLLSMAQRHTITDAKFPPRQSRGDAYLIAVAHNFIKLEERPARYRIGLGCKSVTVLEEHFDVANVMGRRMGENPSKDVRKRKLDSKASVDERVVQFLEQLGKYVLCDRSAVTTVLVETAPQPLISRSNSTRKLMYSGKTFIRARNLAGFLRIASTSRAASRTPMMFLHIGFPPHSTPPTMAQPINLCPLVDLQPVATCAHRVCR